jgi:hypothetical protein
LKWSTAVQRRPDGAPFGSAGALCAAGAVGSSSSSHRSGWWVKNGRRGRDDMGRHGPLLNGVAHGTSAASTDLQITWAQLRTSPPNATARRGPGGAECKPSGSSRRQRSTQCREVALEQLMRPTFVCYGKRR